MEEGLSYLFAAYTAIWLVLMAYTFYLWNKHSKLQREVRTLRRSLKKKDND